MRILKILYDERIGGPQMEVMQVAKGLRERGIETVVVMPKGDRAFGEALAEAGTVYHQIVLPRPRAGLKLRHHFAFAACFWTSVARIRTLIRRERIDIVHNNGIMNWQGAIAARREGVPLLWHLNDINTPKPLALVGRVVLDRTASAIAVSANAVAVHYFGRSDHPRLPTYLLYAPVEIERFATAATARPLEGGPYIGTVGNINPIKGHRYLIDAAPAVIARYPKAQFLIAGAALANRPTLIRSLHAAAAHNGVQRQVTFLGGVEDIPTFLDNLDLYVHPSLSEACSLAVLEAMAAGKPIVATDVGGTRELVPDGVAGRLVPKADATALANAIIETLGDKKNAAAWAATARLRCAELFDVSHAVDMHERVYREVVCRA